MADSTPLIACLMDIERHVSSAGWDQPARLFALVTTGTLLEVEPQLRGRVPETALDALTAIEQDEFHATGDLEERLAAIFWPDTVEGCAIALERFTLPPAYEKDIPDDDEAAEAFVAAHPERVSTRVVAGVLRGGARYGLARLSSHPDELPAGEDLAPGLTEALLATFREEESS